jgi:hypothetical protein
MIRCPKTGFLVNTGVSVGSQADYDNNNWENCKAGCPHCGQNHTWSKKDAFLEKPH